MVVENDQVDAIDFLWALTKPAPPCTVTSVEKDVSEMKPVRTRIHPVFAEWYAPLLETR